MNRKETERRQAQADILHALGFTCDEAEKLRKISRTLQRWHELECGVGDRDTFYVERETEDESSAPFMHNANTGRKWRIPDRETGAKKRLAAILDRLNRARDAEESPQGAPISAYIQTDPRGVALYILRPGDVPRGQKAASYYTRGICVY